MINENLDTSHQTCALRRREPLTRHGQSPSLGAAMRRRMEKKTALE
jgi:hypothetical protein